MSETQDFADAGELDSDLVAADIEDTDDEIEIEDEIADESADFAQEDDDEFDEDEDDEDSEDESDDSSSLERADDNDDDEFEDDEFEDDDEFDDDDDSEESVVEVAVPAGPVFALESLPVTGEARVDDALGRLGDLEGLPVSEHPAVFEDVQRRLHDTLADLAGS